MRLLIIEDEVKINNALRQGFIEEGFEADSIYDGSNALEKISENEYDCIVLDLMLPGMNGMQILSAMRRKKIYTPVIILTARDAVDEKIAGLDGGSDDYLAKPFSFNELLARVKALIRRDSAHQETLTAGGLIFDPYNKTITRNGSTISITGKDFVLLEYLLRHKGSTISEDRLIRYVWGDSEDINSNVVASHIKNLRQRVDKAFPDSPPIIKTLRGLGYRIDG